MGDIYRDSPLALSADIMIKNEEEREKTTTTSKFDSMFLNKSLELFDLKH